MTSETANGFGVGMPEAMKRWAMSLLFGIAIGSGGLTAVNKAFPLDYSPVIISAVDRAIEPLVTRIEKIELKSNEIDKLLADRGNTIAINSNRLTNLEARYSQDVAAIREGITRVENWIMELKSAGSKQP